jgi:subtilase family serine protease
VVISNSSHLALSCAQRTATNIPDKSLFNQTGAGIPDVAAQAVNFWIVYHGFSTGVSGTSCASPTFAGIVALLNDIRLQNGLVHSMFPHCKHPFLTDCPFFFQENPPWDG